MLIYLDSCALVKLVRAEPESEALQAWLDERPREPLVSSELARAEVVRTVRRVSHSQRGELLHPETLVTELAEANQLLAALAYVAVNRDVLVGAGELAMPMTRTLDAIHLVSARRLGAGLTHFVTYDKRLASAARDAGLTVVAPV
ncbi:MAG: type II toxin-antitoxin system VapC family toxin [Actinomycetota bacterium]|nr:type II toxin-antitoxin system VapC family toxin [Actinomycetota bacterium]